jgi:hypothetical protein
MDRVIAKLVSRGVKIQPPKPGKVVALKRGATKSKSKS